MLLDGDDHVRQHRRTAGAGDDEEVGKARAHQAEIGARAFRPFLVQRLPAAADDVDLGDRAGHGVKAGRQHQRVGLIILAGDAHGVFGDLLDRIGLDVDQLDIRPVEGREIIRVDADALGADRVAVRLQQLCRGGILDDLGDLAADEIGGGVVGGLVEQEVVVDGHEHHAAMLPAAPHIWRGAHCRRRRARRGRAARYRCRCATPRGRSGGLPDSSS